MDRGVILRPTILLFMQYMYSYSPVLTINYSARHLLCIKTPLTHVQYWCTINDEYCINISEVDGDVTAEAEEEADDGGDKKKKGKKGKKEKKEKKKKKGKNKNNNNGTQVSQHST